MIPSSRRKILGLDLVLMFKKNHWLLTLRIVVGISSKTGAQYVGKSSLLPIHAIIIFQTHFLVHDVFSES